MKSRHCRPDALALMPTGKRKSDNHGSSQEWQMPVSNLLRRIADRHAPNARTCEAERKRGSPKPKLTDEQVLEMRRRHEREGWSARRCAEHYGLTLVHARKHLDYTTRSWLIPA